MIRLLLRLCGIKDYEICQSCETLKQQLAFERDEKKQLTETLLNILQPKVVQAAPVEINPTIQTSGLFGRRRAAMESKDREEARILKEAKHVGKPDDRLNDVIDKKIEELEQQLDIQTEKEA